jgi:hypothetical protein
MPMALRAKSKKAWDTLKEALIKAPVLIQANPMKEYFVDTDASGMGIGAALMQFGQDGKLHPIAYISRNYKPGEAKYHTRDQEALAIYWSVLKLDEYLSAKKFYVITDHASLRWAIKAKGIKSRIDRWMSYLTAHYQFEILYRRGKLNKLADFLSRYPAIVHNIMVHNIMIQPVQVEEKQERNTEEEKEEKEMLERKIMREEEEKKERIRLEEEQVRERKEFIELSTKRCGRKN